MSESKLIKAWIYNPDRSIFKEKKTEPAVGHVYYCTKSEECELYKSNKCLMVGSNTRCKFGTHNRIRGKSRRAAGFYSWIADFEEKHKDVIDVRLSYPKKLEFFLDFIYLPYSFLGLNKEIEFVSGNTGYFTLSDNDLVVSREWFTPENVLEYIIDFIPNSLFGGIIYDYQNKVVPLFLKHLKSDNPEFLNKIISLRPSLKETIGSLTDVGRIAILQTLTPNIGTFKDIHGGIWSWDGEYVYCTNRHPSFTLLSSSEEVRLKPSPKQEVKVSDDGQVNENTEFID